MAERHSPAVFNRVVKEIFLLCPVFFIETALVRYFVDINSLVPVDAIIIPSLCALTMLSCVSVENAPLEFSLRKNPLIFNASAFAVFFFLNLKMEALVLSWGWPLFAALWFIFAILALGSSFCVFVKPSSLYKKLRAHPYETGFGILAGLSQALYEFINGNLWPYLASPTTLAVRGVLFLSGLPTESARPTEIVHPIFGARIGRGCSGFEGVFFFIFVFCILAMLDWKKFSLRRLSALFASGILLMVALNILRIALFFALGIWLSIKLGKSKAAEWFIWTFHSHAGWLLYFVGIGLFLMIFFILPSDRKRKAS